MENHCEQNDEEVDDQNVDNEVEITSAEAISMIDYIQEPSQSNSDTQIIVDGTWHYKASIIRQLLNRLKRVEGLSKFCNGSKSTVKNIENIVMQSDPILYESTLALIHKLIVCGKETKYIDGDSLQDKNVTLVLRKMKLNLEGEHYFATGETTGKYIKTTGEHCRMIQPEVVDGKLAYNKSLVFDLAVDLQQGQDTGSSSSGSGRKKNDKDNDKLPCKICKKNVLQSRMHTHVGKHTLKKDIPADVNICGWCVSTQCYKTTLVNTSKKGIIRYSTQMHPHSHSMHIYCVSIVYAFTIYIIVYSSMAGIKYTYYRRGWDVCDWNSQSCLKLKI